MLSGSMSLASDAQKLLGILTPNFLAFDARILLIPVSTAFTNASIPLGKLVLKLLGMVRPKLLTSTLLMLLATVGMLFTAAGSVLLNTRAPIFIASTAPILLAT